MRTVLPYIRIMAGCVGAEKSAPGFVCPVTLTLHSSPPALALLVVITQNQTRYHMKSTQLATLPISPDTLSPIIYNGVRVVTTGLLALLYGASVKRVQNNYLRNESRFEMGKHYFKLEGGELKEFKNRPSLRGSVGPRTTALLLWTERGAARHAKMLETDLAWEVFERLEDSYFNVAPVADDDFTSEGFPSVAGARVSAWSYADRILRQCNQYAERRGIDIDRWETVDAQKMADGLLMDILSRHRVVLKLNHRFELVASMENAGDLLVSPGNAASVINLVSRIDDSDVLAEMLRAGVDHLAALKKPV